VRGVTDRRRSRHGVLGVGPGATGVVALVALAGWASLVLLAVRVGRSARDAGGAPEWVLTVLVGMAAAACLLVAFLLAARARELVVRRRALRQPGGRHRA
jgi:hypothetical protein